MNKPTAVEKLKNEDVANRYKLNLHNRFQVLQDLGSNVKEQWRTFRQVVTEVAKESIGRRRGSQNKIWIKERNWKIIGGRKSPKYRMQRKKHCPRKKKLRMNIQISIGK